MEVIRDCFNLQNYARGVVGFCYLSKMEDVNTAQCISNVQRTQKDQLFQNEKISGQIIIIQPSDISSHFAYNCQFNWPKDIPLNLIRLILVWIDESVMLKSVKHNLSFQEYAGNQSCQDYKIIKGDNFECILDLDGVISRQNVNKFRNSIF